MIDSFKYTLLCFTFLSVRINAFLLPKPCPFLGIAVSSNSLMYSAKPDSSTEPSATVLDNALKGSATTPSFITPQGVPCKGIIDYIGKSTTEIDDWVNSDTMVYSPPSNKDEFITKFNLWKQWPWKKIKGKVILKVKVGGSIPIESSSSGGFLGFGGVPDLEPVESLTELVDLLQFGAHDPRVHAILMDINPVQCGYAKLQELRKAMKYFRASGKPLIGYCSAGSEKELFVSLGCDEFYIPPDGGLDIRGFSGSATFVRGVFDKIGIEPQVQRIGKYKSFGDTFNRTSISEAQREVISSLLTETSDFWVDSVAKALNKSTSEVYSLWSSEGVKTAYDYRDLGYVSGVRYLDQVEESLKIRFRKPEVKPSAFSSWLRRMKSNAEESSSTAAVDNADGKKIDDSEVEPFSDYDLPSDFSRHARRSVPKREKVSLIVNEQGSNDTDLTAESLEKASASRREEAKQYEKEFKAAVVQKLRTTARNPSLFPAGLYLRKMRKGYKILRGPKLVEVTGGKRIAIINAVGGISTGRSSSGGINGKSLGSDSLIALLRAARNDPSIRAVVLRIDSPGGSALASDLMWRELRRLSREKPVIASQVDVAASGGYYLSMGCDYILAEEATITGSIGVVTSKFNAENLNSKIGLNTETLSIGRYAEILSSSRGFTDDENAYFEEGAWKAYTSFITKAAASRNMTVEDMNEVAQGRVWTGRQALERNLVDELGGLWKALLIASRLSNITVDASTPIRVQTLKDTRSGFALPFRGASSSMLQDALGAGYSRKETKFDDLRFSCDDVIFASGLVSPSSVGFGLSASVLMTEAMKGPIGQRILQALMAVMGY